MKVSGDDPRPAYVQIADDLRRQIVDGEYAMGQRISTGNELSRQYSVSLGTAQRAVDLLVAEGMLESRRGRGVFVASSDVAVQAHSVEYLEIRDQIDAINARLDAIEKIVRRRAR